MTRHGRHANPVLPGRVFVRVVAGLQLLGIDVRPALEHVKLTPEQLGHLDDEIPMVWLRTFWDGVVRSTGQSGLGLRLAEQVRPETYEVFGCLLAASATLGEAALHATRLIGLVTRTVRLSFHHEGDRASLSIEPRFPEVVHPETIEFMVGAACVISRRISGRAHPLVEVRFAHGAPPDLAHHERLFAAPIHFGCSSNGLIFDGSLLGVPIQSRDSALCETLRRQAEELMGSEPSNGFKAEVRAALATELRAGDPSAERVAARLAVHPKTLTRRLKSEGTTFRRLLEELRLQLAERYLRQPGLSVEEVAFLLGYSERSAFHRAFHRWTGRGPRAAEVK